MHPTAPTRAPRRRCRTITPPPGVTVSLKLVAKMTEHEVRQCSALTLRWGMMRERLERIRSYLGPEVRNLHCLHSLTTERVLLVRRNRRLVAWALVLNANPRLNPNIYMFVAPEERRCGLATLLSHEVLDRWLQAEFNPWDRESAAFFLRFRATRSLRFTSQGVHYLTKIRRADAQRAEREPALSRPK